MEALFLLLIFMAIIIVGVPIGWGIGFVAMLSLLLCNGNMTVIPSKMVGGVNNFTYMCIPFFILAANVMSYSGITNRILNFCNALVGHIRGGLAHVNVLASMFFGGISGAASADAAGLGPIEIELMTKNGYPRDHSAAVTAASAVLSPIIPPSNIMIIYAVIAGNVSVSAMFLGGIMPGIVLVTGMMILNYIIAKKLDVPCTGKFAGFRVVLKTFWQTLPALFMPAIILGGILGGVFTPTESAVVAAAYALLISAFGLRTLSWKKVWEGFKVSAKMTSVILFVISTASAMGWGITAMQLPQKISAICLSWANTDTGFLLITFAILVVIGMLLDVTPAMLIMVPILLPAAISFGISPLRFGLICSITLTIGLITPPVGMLLFTTSTISKVDLSALYKQIIPYAIIELLCLFIIIFFEPVTMLIPSLFGY